LIKLGNDEEDLQVEENIILNEQLHMIPIDSSREICSIYFEYEFFLLFRTMCNRYGLWRKYGLPIGIL
jgi:hypothetical protein